MNYKETKAPLTTVTYDKDTKWKGYCKSAIIEQSTGNLISLSDAFSNTLPDAVFYSPNAPEKKWASQIFSRKMKKSGIKTKHN